MEQTPPQPKGLGGLRHRVTDLGATVTPVASGPPSGSAIDHAASTEPSSQVNVQAEPELSTLVARPTTWGRMIKGLTFWGLVVVALGYCLAGV